MVGEGRGCPSDFPRNEDVAFTSSSRDQPVRAARLRRRHAVLVAQKERLLAELAAIESQLSGQSPSGHAEEEE